MRNGSRQKRQDEFESDQIVAFTMGDSDHFRLQVTRTLANRR